MDPTAIQAAFQSKYLLEYIRVGQAPLRLALPHLLSRVLSFSLTPLLNYRFLPTPRSPCRTSDSVCLASVAYFAESSAPIPIRHFSPGPRPTNSHQA
eukprot:5744787-Pleurochrysis_carterae.AAC.1